MQALTISFYQGDVQSNWNQDDIRSFFGSYSIASITIKCNARKGWKSADGLKVGFALVEFTYENDAEEVLSTLNGTMICEKNVLYNLKPNVWLSGTAQIEMMCNSESDDNIFGEPFLQDQLNQSNISQLCNITPNDNILGEPSLHDQLDPLTISQLRSRLLEYGFHTAIIEANAQRAGGRVAKKEALIKLLCKLYVYQPIKYPRLRIHLSGKQVPEELLSPLLLCLRRMLWPKKKRNLTAAEYLVLGIPAEGANERQCHVKYGELWKLATAVMLHMAPSFDYSTIAATKNFVGSPHVDMGGTLNTKRKQCLNLMALNPNVDKTWQYAMSLGDFSSGGELCVEASGSAVYVIDTKNKLARVDGRFPHW